MAPYYDQVEKSYGLPPGTMRGLVAAENTAPGVTSSAGARTQFQIIPSTARDLGVDLNDPKSAMHGAARYYKQQLDAFGDPGLAYAAYNAGPGTVQNILKNKGSFDPGVQHYMNTGLEFSKQNSDYKGVTRPAPGSMEAEEATVPSPPPMAPLSAPVPQQPAPAVGTVLGPLAGSPAVQPTPESHGHKFARMMLMASNPEWAGLGDIIKGLRGGEA